jgi:hypothetical protein
LAPLMAHPINRSSMLFGRYWGLNGHREALEVEVSLRLTRFGHSLSGNACTFAYHQTPF